MTKKMKLDSDQARRVCYAHGVRDTGAKTYSGRKICIYEAAEMLGVSRETVRRMIGEGTLIAWLANPRGRKRMLWEAQVKELAATQQAEAAEQARLLQLELPLF